MILRGFVRFILRFSLGSVNVVYLEKKSSQVPNMCLCVQMVHVLCAVAVLEARFVNIAERSPVDLSGIPYRDSSW